MSVLRREAFMPRPDMIGFVILAVIIFAILPMALDVFRLNLVGKYLTYAFVALGLVLCWGCGGILSLGQGVFFGLGGFIFTNLDRDSHFLERFEQILVCAVITNGKDEIV